MEQKKRLFSSIHKKAQAEGGENPYTWVVYIILGLLLGFALFMLITRWADVFKP